MPEGKLSLIGWWQFLNAIAARTIKDTRREGHPPARARARRVFNYVIPEERLQSLRRFPSPRERAALNVDYIRSAADALNGRL
jgi:hypothetical protein